MTLQEIKDAANGTTTEKTIEALDGYIKKNPADDEALAYRGMKYWSLDKRDLAINDWLAAIKLNPQSKAKMYMKTSYDILNYYNKDLYNP